MSIRVALMAAMALSAGALADTPAAPTAPRPSSATEVRWDDSHMLSRHAETPRSARPRIEGESGYGALSSGNATRSATTVQELEFTTQREWRQGALSTGSNAKAAARASESAVANDGSGRRGRR
jgi:hypothetical protein